MNKLLVLALFIAIGMTPFTAHAQAVGIDTFAQWLVGPVGRPTLIIGAVVLGIIFCVGRRDWEHLVNYAIGGALIGGAATVAAMFAAG